MKIEIEKMDHLGNGIGFLDSKCVFVPKTIPHDIVEIKIIKDKKNYATGKVIKYLKRGNRFNEAFCPYYAKCGGCHLQNFLYEDTLKYKEDRVKNILNKIDVNINLEIIKNKYSKYYRNKIELKICNGEIGFYQKDTHDLVQINTCAITKNCINDFLKCLKTMNIKNGEVMIRCNFNDELLISIKTNDNIILDETMLVKRKVVGIIQNDKCIYGESKFLDKINDLFFEVSYNSFFQVNSYINSKLFEIINDNVNGDTILDLYSGVGTLSLMASKNAKSVYAIENIPNAVINSMKNAKINNIKNVNFILGNVEDKIQFIKDKIDTVIIDPPRAGLDNQTINKILELSPQKIIYVSCETQKFVSDLTKLANNYQIKKMYLLDMFSYTYHVECICVLKLK